jgi:CheY-like chemotaxis protein/anti-sigma regulatory factor (Ser/Thr protein kinase)
MRVQADAARLEQVFVNLLGNAVKYTPENGRIRLTAHCENSEAVIKVADNGVGIPPELLPHVFELFTQGQTSLDRAQGGLGIGLTVVRSLIEMHGGSVQVQSGGAATGSTFTVRLPLASGPQAEAASANAAPARELPVTLRVLIVDDHVDTAQALSVLLSRRNCQVRVAHDGPAGILAAREFIPDVFLLDLGLPGLDGYEIARTLRTEPDFKNALFVAISGYAQKTDHARSLAAGFDHHCAKPVDLPSLLKVIQAKFAESGS